MAALLRLEVPRATVVRDGRPREIEANAIVPGDVILVEVGEHVPADARLMTAVELRSNEAAFRGESVPLDKRAEPTLPPASPLAQRANLLFMSTGVVAGSGLA